jgi:hypothetical protein
MTDPRDEFLPYWLRTATPSGANGGLLDSLTRPPDEPWNDPLPMTFAQTPWGSMTPPPSLFGQSPTFPPSPPPSSWDSSSASLWHTPFRANAGFPAPTPGLPQPPYWDSAASPVEHPDSARYWGVPAAPSGASAQPPTASPTWLPTAKWKAPEAAPRLSFSGPDYAPRTDHTSDHLWVTESSAPTVPRTLVPADLGRRSRDAENALAFARLFAPDLVNYLTTPAPPPQYTPNAAGKIPPIGYHPNEAGAGVELLSNLATGFIPGGAAGKVAMAAAPMAARAARGATKTALPMDAVSIAQRAKAMNMADDVFWRGERSGASPTSYPEGAYFSRLKERGDAFAQQGGRPEAREFRLDLTKALKDYEPVTAEQIGRLVASAARHDPKWAAELVDLVAPGRSVDWMLGYARARPNDLVADSGAHIRQMIDYSANPVRILRGAGFNALDNGVDVRNLDGYGIRLANAVFDPARRRVRNISAALAGGATAPTLADILLNPRPD